MSKLNIKIITYGNFPHGSASANYLRNLCIGFINDGINLEVLLPSGSYYGMYNKVYENINPINSRINYHHLGFKIHPKTYVGKLADFIWGHIQLFFHFIKCANLSNSTVIKYNISASTHIFYWGLSRIFKFKFVCIVPEFYSKDSMSSSILKKIKWLNFYWGIRYFVAKSDGLIVMSYFLRNYLKWIAKANVPAIVIPNAIDPEAFQASTSKRDNDRYNIGYVGTPTEKDGIQDLINAFAIFAMHRPNTFLYIIGDTLKKDEVLNKINTLIKKKKLTEQVILTGHQPHHLIGNILNKCDTFILSRRNNITSLAGFPTKLGEYFCFKKPVILTRIGDFTRYFTDKKEVIFAKPGNPKSIADSLEFAYDNKKLSEQIGLNGHQWMLDNLDYKIITKKLSSFLSQL